MATLSNPRDLVLQQLAELLWIERTLAFEALPKFVSDVRDEELRTALEEHLQQTRFHAARVEEAFRAAGAEPAAARSGELAGLLGQHDEQQATEPGLRDLFHVFGAIRTEHLELALYDALLGLLEDEGLRRNREDEVLALGKLSHMVDRLRAELRA